MNPPELMKSLQAHAFIGKGHSTSTYGEIYNMVKYTEHPITCSRHRIRESTVHVFRGQCFFTSYPLDLAQSLLSREAPFQSKPKIHLQMPLPIPLNQRLDLVRKSKNITTESDIESVDITAAVGFGPLVKVKKVKEKKKHRLWLRGRLVL